MRRKPTSKVARGTFLPSSLDKGTLGEFGRTINFSALNAVAIGSGIFETEQAIRAGRVRKVLLPIYHSGTVSYDLTAIGRLVHELLIFTLVEDIEVDFRPVKRTETASEGDGWERSVSNICLFSGGTDSYAGVLLTKEVLSDV